MSTFEIIILAIYYYFALGYILSAFGVESCESGWDKFWLALVAILICPIIFPIGFASDVYDKLHENDYL